MSTAAIKGPVCGVNVGVSFVAVELSKIQLVFTDGDVIGSVTALVDGRLVDDSIVLVDGRLVPISVVSIDIGRVVVLVGG